MGFGYNSAFYPQAVCGVGIVGHEPDFVVVFRVPNDSGVM